MATTKEIAIPIKLPGRKETPARWYCKYFSHNFLNTFALATIFTMAIIHMSLVASDNDSRYAGDVISGIYLPEVRSLNHSTVNGIVPYIGYIDPFEAQWIRVGKLVTVTGNIRMAPRHGTVDEWIVDMTLPYKVALSNPVIASSITGGGSWQDIDKTFSSLVVIEPGPPLPDVGITEVPRVTLHGFKGAEIGSLGEIFVNYRFTYAISDT